MKRILILLLCLATLLLGGCGTTAKFVYPAKYQNLTHLYDQPKYNLTVAVLPFEDMRGDINSFGGFFLYLIPLVPYGSFKYERPDAARMFNTVSQFEFNVTEDLAKAVVVSLQRSGLFKDVFFTFGGEKANSDLIIKGKILSTDYIGKVYSYGLSVFGPGLSIIGLPAGSSYNKLSLELVLNDKKPAKIWGYNFMKEKTIVQGLYYKFGYDVKSYASLMEEGMNEAIKDMDKKLSSLDLTK
jgi:hypothetical protein